MTLKDQYDSFDKYIRNTGSGSVNTYEQINFAGIVMDTQTNIELSTHSSNTSVASASIDGYMNTILDAMCNLSDNPHLLRAYMEIFQKTNTVKQRLHFQDGEQQALLAEVSALATTVAQMGGGATYIFDPTIGGPAGVINSARSRLEAAIPLNCGSPRMNLIQQFEDVAQFAGMMADVRELDRRALE